MNILNKFYLEQEMKEAVKEFIISHLKEITINKAFNGEPTNGIQEAKNALQNAFKQLDDKYSAKTEKKDINVSE